PLARVAGKINYSEIRPLGCPIFDRTVSESSHGRTDRMSTRVPPKKRSHRPYVMAMVLGTALTALGGERALAAPAAEATQRAITTRALPPPPCGRNARPPADAWGDCTQEVFTRLLERVPPGRWAHALALDSEERREFVRAIDTVKKRTQRAK